MQSPVSTFFQVMREAKYKGGENIPYAFPFPGGGLAVGYTVCGPEAYSEDDDTRIRAMICGIRDSKELLKGHTNS